MSDFRPGARVRHKWGRTLPNGDYLPTGATGTMAQPPSGSMGETHSVITLDDPIRGYHQYVISNQDLAEYWESVGFQDARVVPELTDWFARMRREGHIR